MVGERTHRMEMCAALGLSAGIGIECSIKFHKKPRLQPIPPAASQLSVPPPKNDGFSKEIERVCNIRSCCGWTIMLVNENGDQWKSVAHLDEAPLVSWSWLSTMGMTTCVRSWAMRCISGSSQPGETTQSGSCQKH